MSTPRHELRSLYAEWKALTEAEGEAIRAWTWTKVDQCQNDKAQLRPRILATTELWQACPSYSQNDFDREFRAIVAELIQLEQRNGAWLEDQRQVLTAQQADLSRTSRNLRQVHRAYASGERAAWVSYS